MTLEEERDFYRVWFEYLIRTPAYLRWADWMNRTYSGEYLPFPAELDTFSIGYGAWLKSDRPWEISFDKVYSRAVYRKGLIAEAEENAFSPAAELARSARESLEMEREELGRSLTWQEEEALLEQANRAALEDRETRDREYSEGFKKYRYRFKPPGVNWGPVLSATLKRRLTYYHLAEVCGLFRDEIVMADDLPLIDLPFGPGPFSPDPKEIDFFRYWKRGHACRDPRHFLSEEITEARKTIAAVETGWFPAPPPPRFKNSSTAKPARKIPITVKKQS